MDGQDPLSREARARAYDSFKKIKSRSATMTFGLTPTEVEYHRRIYSPSPEEKLNTPDQNDRENGVLNDMVRDYRYSRELGVTSVPMKPPVINDDGDPTDF